MTYLAQRLTELRRYVDHVRTLAPRVPDRLALERDLSLHNDVLYSLLMISQLVVDIAGEFSSRAGHGFEDYTQAIQNLARDDRFPPGLVRQLERLPGFRNVLVHEYVRLNLDRVIEAVRALGTIEEFLDIVREIESGGRETRWPQSAIDPVGVVADHDGLVAFKQIDTDLRAAAGAERAWRTSFSASIWS